MNGCIASIVGFFTMLFFGVLLFSASATLQPQLDPEIATVFIEEAVPAVETPAPLARLPEQQTMRLVHAQVEHSPNDRPGSFRRTR